MDSDSGDKLGFAHRKKLGIVVTILKIRFQEEDCEEYKKKV